MLQKETKAFSAEYLMRAAFIAGLKRATEICNKRADDGLESSFLSAEEIRAEIDNWLK